VFNCLEPPYLLVQKIVRRTIAIVKPSNLIGLEVIIVSQSPAVASVSYPEETPHGSGNPSDCASLLK
jgi:hypothetical protein